LLCRRVAASEGECGEDDRQHRCCRHSRSRIHRSSSGRLEQSRGSRYGSHSASIMSRHHS
jgi:hypothetical protein